MINPIFIKTPFLSKLGLRESNRVYLIPPNLFHPPKPKINEKMGDLPKLAWSRNVTGKVDNIHSNLTRIDGLQLRHSFFPPKQLDVKMPLQSMGRYRKSTYNSFSGHI